MMYPGRLKSNALLFFSLLIVVALSSCNFFAEERIPDAVPGKTEPRRLVEDDTLFQASPSTKKNIDSARENIALDTEQSRERFQMLQHELESADVRTITHSLETVASAQPLLQVMQQAAKVVDDIYKLQVNSSNLIWEEQLRKSGEPVERAIFDRYAGPWCRFSKALQCNAVASIPPRNTGTIFWPMDFTSREFENLSTLINSKELLSPFGLVERDNGRLTVSSYVAHPRFKEFFAALSRLFSDAASMVARTDRELLSVLSQITGEGNIDTFGIDQRVLDGKAGPWRILFGAFETDLDVYGVKQAFEFQLARPYLPANEFTDWFTAHYEELYDSLTAMHSENMPLNKGKPMIPSIEVRDTWIAAGHARFSDLSAVRHIHSVGHLPAEKVIVDLNRFSAQLEEDARSLNTVMPLVVLSVDSALLNRVSQELASSLLPAEWTVIDTENGKQIGLKQLYRKQWSQLISILVQVTTAWIVSMEREMGRIDDAGVSERGIALAARWLSGTASSNKEEQQVCKKLLEIGFAGHGMVYNAQAKQLAFYPVPFFNSVQSYLQVLLTSIYGARVSEVAALIDSGKATESHQAILATVSETIKSDGRKPVLFDYQLEPVMDSTVHANMQ
ncbi:MAG: hypothetical protein JXX29_04935 [Deltaproteobacteria bacterium]|nr:hypothetical protein [Deltaproteobacteria bacterium]MBN2670992.1 hypothetical protein [Deltaproteobacteria bacterium]